MFFLFKLLVALWTVATFTWVYVEARGRRRVFDAPLALPAMEVGLVLGCTPANPLGTPNDFFLARVDCAAAAFHARRCKALLLSGSGGPGLNQPQAMKAALVAEGVPENRIYLDPMGFRTFESMYRARDVFEIGSVLIISQRFHNLRAICIADRLGLPAVALNARHPGGASVWKMAVREIGSRFRMMLELYPFLLPRDYKGERHPIDLD